MDHSKQYDSGVVSIEQELEDLRVTAIGLEPRRAPAARPQLSPPTADPTDHLSRQLDTLKMMFTHRRDDDYRANFDYIVQRALFTMANRPVSEFGDARLYRGSEMLDLIYRRSHRRV